MNKKFIFSGYNTGKTTKRGWNISLDVLYEKTKESKKLREETLEIRASYACYKEAKARWEELCAKENCEQEIINAAEKGMKDWEKKYKEAKVQLPIITVHASFPEGRKDTDPHTYYNTILTDIDHVSEEQINELMFHLKKLPFILFVCRSVRGEGIHILSYVEVEGNIKDDNFKDVFEATTRIVEYILNIEVDRSVSSISRCMFLNHDEQAYYNPEATPLNVDATLWLKKNNSINFNIESSMNKREQLAAYLDVADPHLDWSAGNRHSTVVSLASSLNKAGFDVEDVVEECTSRYAQADFDADEIEKTVRDIYNRYSSEHGINQKSPQPQKDKGTKGHKDIVQDNDDDFVDEDEILSTQCPEIENAKRLIPDYFWDYIIPKKRGRDIRFVALISLLVAVGTIFRKVRCLMRDAEIVKGKLFFLVSGPAASGKSCIGKGHDFFLTHAKKIEKESREEIRKKEEEYNKWKKCQKDCKEEDCGCGAEPVIPKEIRINLSPNISASKLIHTLANNLDFSSLLYTTELDCNLDIKDSPLSPVLRLGYEHESVSSYTHMHGDVCVDAPEITMLVAGTPAQVVHFLKTKENGLASRFLTSYLPVSKYRKLADEPHLDYDIYMAQKEAFERRAETFSQYAMNADLVFELTPRSQDAIDDHILEMIERYASFASDELTGFIMRLTKMNVSMAMALATFGLYEQNSNTRRHDIPDDIIDTVLTWNPYFIEQHIRLLSDLPGNPVNKDSNEIECAHIFSKLPCDFTFAEARNIFSKHMNVSTKTVGRKLKMWVEAGKLNAYKKGHYSRTDCSETSIGA